MKKFWLHSLLRLYTIILVGVLGFVALIISYGTWQSEQQEAVRVINRVSSRTTDEVDYYYQRASQASQGLVDNTGKLEGLYQYFTLSPADYQRWKFDNPYSSMGTVSLHENIYSLYVNNDFIDSLDIALKDYKTVFVSTRNRPGGQQVSAQDFHPSKSAFPITLYDSRTDEDIGIIYVTMRESTISRLVQTTRGELPISVLISSPFDEEMFDIQAREAQQPQTWLRSETTHGYQVAVGLAPHYVLRESLLRAGLIVVACGILILVLYVILVRIFANYQHQVVDIVDTLQRISQGEEAVRIDTQTKEDELLLVADNVNTMLDHLDANIRDIYELQILQQDANMRALQAQINPHFMYNTLEFIRMYAVMHEQDELGDIIYEFSSLLRNNISDERTTTLEKELEFCRKYSYLCMVRYPKSVAYGFKIDPGLEGMVIPKFTIQPLVENYFAHGIDHRKLDNVISVKALKRETGVEIIVTDNGSGMKEEQLAAIRRLLQERTFSHTEARKSIGIVNVHERFVLFFGDRYQIEVDSEEQKGVTYRIFIENEGNKNV